MKTLLVDCRPPEAYAEGHPPGAVHLDPESALTAPGRDPVDGGRHPVPSAEKLAETFGRIGVDADTFVLALDEGTGWAARCWWLLRHVGHGLAGTLDLRGYRGPLTTEVPEAEPALLTARERTDDTIAADEIFARLDDPALVLLDARAPERWRGDVEPLDPVAGRIPGALNAPFTEPLPAGVTAARELAVYCGSGVTAAVVVQKLVLAGREDARMYPGSFSEWCRRERHPIERSSPQ
ncbi:MAG: rhodanese-like domain-containing protein [Gaiellales bacterium]